MSRRAEREQAFIVVFEGLFSDTSVAEIIESGKESLDWIDSEYVTLTANGVAENLEVIDEHIINNLKTGWTFARLSKVVLALLRLAVFEMKYLDDVPVSVAINEAVELCKNYATEADAAFLNGILGSIAKEIE